MHLIRQETDYALRLIAELATTRDGRRPCLPTRILATSAGVPYEYACKILQKLHETKLIESIMGPKGGFRLTRNADAITLLEIINAVQGPLSINTCAAAQGNCDRQCHCPLTGKLGEFQAYMEKFFEDITLAQVMQGSAPAVKEEVK